MVFGRRAGINAAKRVKKTKLGKITLEHVMKYEKMLDKVSPRKKAPVLIPDYRGKDVLFKYKNLF